MKIAHVMSYFQPALGYDDLFLAQAQQRRGHSPTIIAADRYRPFPDYEQTVAPVLGRRRLTVGERDEAGLRTIRLPARVEARTQVWLGGLGRALRGLAPDVVHLHGSLTLLGAQTAGLCARWGLPLVADNHHEPETFRTDAISRRVFFAAFRAWGVPRLRRGARAFAAINEASQSIFARALALPPQAVTIIPLGADADLFRPDPVARAHMRAELATPAEAVVLLYAGKVIPSKDVHVLAEAFVRAAPDAPDLWLLLVGSAESGYRAQVERTLAPAAARVRWLPPAPNADLPRYYSAADIGVWPSESSNAMIEAASVGLPIVVADTPANAHRISNDNGLGVARGDVAGLANALLRLARDPNLRGEMGRRGRELVERELSWTALADRWLALYAQAMG